MELDEVVARLATIARTAIDPTLKRIYIENDVSSPNLAINSIVTAEGDKITIANREKVLVELGKHMGGFVEKVETDLNVDLADKLKRARERANIGYIVDV